MLNKAIEIAARAHAGQKDKAGQPYILHLLRVMLSSRLSSVTARICAVLHDVLEDTDVSKEELHELFGNDVVWNLQLLTHAPNEPYADYIHRVMQSSIAIEVKLADLDDNAQWERLRYLNEHDSSRMMKKYTMAYQMLIQKEN